MLERQILRWLGGKWKMAPWIITHFPNHEVYIEAFGGGANVLFRKESSRIEIYNEKHDDLVNFFQIIADRDNSNKLIAALSVVPFSREEFNLSYEPCIDPIGRAVKFLVFNHMGFGTHSMMVKTGFRSGEYPPKRWSKIGIDVAEASNLCNGLIVTQMDAINLIQQRDDSRTLFYLDPPYVQETRGTTRGYAHEMNDQQQEAFLQTCASRTNAMIVISGYRCKMYNDMLPGWLVVEKEALAERTKPKIEVLWINPAAQEAKKREMPC
jgi:DNA adenine methylase